MTRREAASKEIREAIRPPDGYGATMALSRHFGVSYQAISRWWIFGIPGNRALEVADFSGVDFRRVYDAVRGNRDGELPDDRDHAA